MASALGQPQSVESASYNDAVARAREGGWTEACEIAARLVETQPKLYAPHNLLGLCAARQGDRAKAEAAFRKSVELSPSFADSRNNLGIELLRRGERDEAMEQFAASLRADPNNVTAHHNLGRIQLDAGAHEEALRHLKAASELAPGDVPIRIALAEVLALTGQKTSARETLRDALMQRPSLAPALLTLARDASSRGRYEKVRAILAGFDPAPSQAAEWHALAGYAEYKLGDPERAEERMRQAVALDPKTEQYWLNLAELLLFHRSFAAASAYLEAGLRNLPESARLHLGLGVAQIARGGSDEEGLRHLETALQIEPDLELALAALCEAHYLNRSWKALDRAAARWLRTNSAAAQAYYFQAISLIEGGSRERPESLVEAERLLSESIQLRPTFAPSRLAMGKLRNTLKQPTLAIEEFRAAIAADPEDAASQYQLAMTYRRLGQMEMSLRALETFKQMKAKQEDPRIVFQLSKDGQ